MLPVITQVPGEAASACAGTSTSTISASRSNPVPSLCFFTIAADLPPLKGFSWRLLSVVCWPSAGAWAEAWEGPTQNAHGSRQAHATHDMEVGSQESDHEG